MICVTGSLTYDRLRGPDWDTEVPIPATACQPGENANEGNGGSAPRADQALLKAVARPRRWFDDLVSGRAQSIAEIARGEGITGRHLPRLIRLPFLAPEIVEAIAQGRQPADLTTPALTQRVDLPLDWTAQEEALAV
jgi:site-specific DNA recombinase